MDLMPTGFVLIHQRFPEHFGAIDISAFYFVFGKGLRAI